MNTLELIHILDDLECFLGVFTRDKLPTKKLSKPAGVVINTDTTDGPGEHWISCFFPKDSDAEYFDSYGLPPLHEEVVDFLHLNSPRGFSYNSSTLQAANSNVCGNYCILFLYARCHGYKFSDVISVFSRNKNINDLLVKIYTSEKTPIG